MSPMSHLPETNVAKLTPVLRFLLNLIISVKKSNGLPSVLLRLIRHARPDIERNGTVNSYTPFSHASFRRSSPTDTVREYTARPQERTVRVVTSESLFRGTHEIGIEHSGSMYRLKITRQGKLILNK